MRVAIVAILFVMICSIAFANTDASKERQDKGRLSSLKREATIMEIVRQCQLDSGILKIKMGMGSWIYECVGNDGVTLYWTDRPIGIGHDR